MYTVYIYIINIVIKSPTILHISFYVRNSNSVLGVGWDKNNENEDISTKIIKLKL